MTQLDPQEKKLNVFRLLRIAKDKTVKELAAELSVTPAYINAIENGDRFPSDSLVQEYAKAFNVSTETISTFKPSENGPHRFERTMLSLLEKICEVAD